MFLFSLFSLVYPLFYVRYMGNILFSCGKHTLNIVMLSSHSVEQEGRTSYARIIVPVSV